MSVSFKVFLEQSENRSGYYEYIIKQRKITKAATSDIGPIAAVHAFKALITCTWTAVDHENGTCHCCGFWKCIVSYL